MYSAYTTPSIFYDDTELSSTALKIIQDNILILDSIAERGFNGMRIKNLDTGVGGSNHAIWYGSFQKRSGMTTAYLRMYLTPVFGETLRILFNDVEVYNATMPSGDTTLSFDITGYANNVVVRVDIFAVKAGLQSGSFYGMVDAYCTPVGYSTAWSSPATFGSLTTVNLNTFVNAQRHIAERLVYPYVPLTVVSRWLGGYWSTGKITKLGTWRLIKTKNKTRLRVGMNVASRHNRSTQIDITINGVSVDSFTFGAWEYNSYTRDIDITAYADDTYMRIEVIETILLGPGEWRGAVNTKYDFRAVGTYNGNYTTPTIGNVFTMLEDLTFSQLQTRLNTVGSALTTIYNKFTSMSLLLDRVQMFGRRPVADFAQEEFFKLGYHATRVRQGEVLVVSGKNLSIYYGLDTTDWDKVDNMEFSYEYQTALIDNSTVQTKVYYLDEFPALFHGQQYYIVGDRLDFAAEYFKY